MTTPHSTNHIQSLVNRIERLEEERKNIAADIKEVYAEAKSNGFDCKIIRKLIAKRKKDAADVAEEQSMMDVYEAALGGIDRAPQSFVRPDGVKVTLERAGAKSAEYIAGIAIDRLSQPDATTFTVDLTTGEITEQNSDAGNAASETLSESDGPIIASETAEGEGATTSPSATLSEQDHASPVGGDLEAVGEVSPDQSSTAVPFDDDLTVPEFLRRGKPYTASDYLTAG